MVRHAESIKKQSGVKDNLWCWAVNDLGELNAALEVVTPVYEASESAVVTSRLEVLEKAQSNADEWLTSHCEKVRNVTEHLERPLSELVSIHNIKLQHFVNKDNKKMPRVSSAKTRQAVVP
jgi:hypothetical protein